VGDLLAQTLRKVREKQEDGQLLAQTLRKLKEKEGETC
jgi:hypothetical protein